MTTATDKTTFLKNWASSHFRHIDEAIKKHFNGKVIHTHRETILAGYRTFKWYNHLLGMAYTSSGLYACYTICNVDVSYILKDGTDTGYHYKMFAIGENGKYYAILWDKDEKELIIEL